MYTVDIRHIIGYIETYASRRTPSAPTRISAAAPPATAFPAIRFCRLNSLPNASFVLFLSTRRAARSCFTASLRAFFSSAVSPRGRLIVSGRAASVERRCVSFDRSRLSAPHLADQNTHDLPLLPPPTRHRPSRHPPPRPRAVTVISSHH